jgi:hypothetical protein
MKTIFVFLGFLVALNSFGAYPGPSETRDILDLSPPGSRVQLGTQLVDKTVHVLEAKYNVLVQGGTSGPIGLLDLDGKSAKLPNNSIVVDCLIAVTTAPTSTAAATIALGTGASTIDLKAATAVGSYTGKVACIPVGSAATSILITTGETSVVATIGVGNLDAGFFKVFIHYIMNN